jgi:hypothetical protein
MESPGAVKLDQFRGPYVDQVVESLPPAIISNHGKMWAIHSAGGKWFGAKEPEMNYHLAILASFIAANAKFLESVHEDLRVPNFTPYQPSAVLFRVYDHTFMSTGIYTLADDWDIEVLARESGRSVFWVVYTRIM